MKESNKKVIIGGIIALVIITIIVVVIIKLITKKEKITTLGRIELTALDGNREPIEGVKFNFIDQYGNVLMEVKTGKDGIVDFYSVPVGEYILEILDEIEGYEVSEKSQKVNVTGGNLTEVIFMMQEIS